MKFPRYVYKRINGVKEVYVNKEKGPAATTTRPKDK